MVSLAKTPTPTKEDISAYFSNDDQESTPFVPTATPSSATKKQSSKALSSSRTFIICSVLLNIVLLLHEFHDQFVAIRESEVSTVSSKYSVNANETNYRASANSASNPDYSSTAHGYTHQPVIYAHIHMAKTAGTEINGELAAHYERVCGHKGYSFDSYQVNQRNEAWIRQNPQKSLTEKNGPEDSIPGQKSNRGRVPPDIMNERGYQDCSWISIEETFAFWQGIARQVHPIPLEFHVPCRDPVDYLLSMGNHKGKGFNCNIDDDQIPAQVNKMVLGMDRFDDNQLKNWEPRLTEGVALKCFQPVPIDPYLEYVGTKLQPKQLQRSYVHRSTNKARDKTKECLRTDEVMKKKVKDYLEETFPIFQFCKKCVGTKDDLLV